jgi:hypothetical protein
MLIIVDCSSNPSMWQCLVKEVPNITLIVAWRSIQLIDKLSTVMFQLWHEPRSQHVPECFAIHGSTRKEVRAIHFGRGNGTKHFSENHILFQQFGEASRSSRYEHFAC